MVDLSQVSLDMVTKVDEARFRALMQEHHFLGDAQPRGETIRYVAHCGGRWLALAMFSASALLCAARDDWIGWERGSQFSRLHLVTNNSRFLVLPGGVPNLGSRVLSLCARRLVRDWPLRFGHEVLLMETFVDPARHRGTVYRAGQLAPCRAHPGLRPPGQRLHHPRPAQACLSLSTAPGCAPPAADGPP